jgi:signal transduction histidine kinase
MRALLGARRNLEKLVDERTQELKSSNERLLGEREARIRLERSTLKIAETERARLASELHDDLGQTLTASACLVQSLAQDLRGKWDEGADQADAIEQHLSGAVEKTRLLAQGLMPLASQVGSIWVALEQLAQHAREIFRIDCRVVCDPAAIIEDRNAAQELYRIAQEGVLNAVRHGHAALVSIEFSVSETGSRMRLRVIDNGGGVDAERMQARTGVGLRILRQRCRSIGLDMRLEPNPEGGTILVVE